MTTKGVTNAQLDHLKRMAKAKGVDRDLFQKGLDGGLFSSTLDTLTGKRTPTIIAPPWGRIHFVDDVPVRLDREWQTAINEAGPGTPADYAVRRVGHLYSPTGTGTVCAKFVLVNLVDDSYRWALDWAKQYNLRYATPRHVFALAKHKPDLNRELNMDSMYIISPVECAFEGARVCRVWFSGGVRGADAHWVGSVGGADGWLVFLCE